MFLGQAAGEADALEEQAGVVALGGHRGQQLLRGEPQTLEPALQVVVGAAHVLHVVGHRGELGQGRGKGGVTGELGAQQGPESIGDVAHRGYTWRDDSIMDDTTVVGVLTRSKYDWFITLSAGRGALLGACKATGAGKWPVTCYEADDPRANGGRWQGDVKVRLAKHISASEGTYGAFELRLARYAFVDKATKERKAGVRATVQHFVPQND